VDNIIDIGDQGVTKFIDKRYHMDLKKTKRIYPHVHNMDGFYFAKLVKNSNLIKKI
jgi:ribosomal RNA methyltransferase Nop2